MVQFDWQSNTQVCCGLSNIEYHFLDIFAKGKRYQVLDSDTAVQTSSLIWMRTHKTDAARWPSGSDTFIR